MKSMIWFLLLLLCSCTSTQNPETKEWTALYSIINDSLIVTDTKEFEKLSNSAKQCSDHFLRLYQNDVFLSSQIIRRTVFAEILDKKGAVVNSINVTTNYPSEKSELIRRSLYIVGEVNFYPFNKVNELTNLYKIFDELSIFLVNDKNLK
jgi:hypothetical protein